MTSQLKTIAKLLIGSLNDFEGSETLKVSINEIKRLKRAVDSEDARLVSVSVDFYTQRFEFLDLKNATFDEPFFCDTIDNIRRQGRNLINFEVDFEDFLKVSKHGDC